MSRHRPEVEMIIASEVRETVATEYDVACRWNLKKWFRDFPGG